MKEELYQCMGIFIMITVSLTKVETEVGLHR